MEINGCAYPFDRAKTWYPTTDRPVTRARNAAEGPDCMSTARTHYGQGARAGLLTVPEKGRGRALVPVSIAASKCLPSIQTKPTPFTSRVNRATSAEAAGLPASTHRYA